MPKRKVAQTDTNDGHFQELHVPCQARRSKRLKNKSQEHLSYASTQKNKPCQVLPSPSSSTSVRSNQGQTRPLKRRDHPATGIEVERLPKKARVQVSKSESTAHDKRKHGIQTAQTDKEVHGLSPDPNATPPPCSNTIKQLQSLESGVSEDRRLPQVTSKACFSIEEETHPVEHWVWDGTWPSDFAMASSSSNKRPRTDSLQSRSYSQSRKNGEVPEPYTAEYEDHIRKKGLDMSLLKGRELVSDGSKQKCINLQTILSKAVKPITFSQDDLFKVIDDCQTRNEAYIIWILTPIISPPITFCRLIGEKHLENIIDERNAIWHKQCVLEGPQIQPDLAIGLSNSAFTETELAKLKRYNNFENWTQFTTKMYFPFLLLEVKCGRIGLDAADRQNMHSCSVAVKAILKIEQTADQFRKEGEKKLNSLNGEILVFSLSHDQKDVRIYGYYAVIQAEKWTYYRYAIKSFDLFTNEGDLLIVYNFVQNALKTHAKKHLERLQSALAVIPEHHELQTGLSFTTSELAIEDTNQQQDSQNVSDPVNIGFRKPVSSVSSASVLQKEENAQLRGQIGQLLQQMEQQREDMKKQMEQQREDSKEREERLLRQLEQQRGGTNR